MIGKVLVILSALCVIISALSCKSESGIAKPDASEWLVYPVISGGVSKDGIPALTNPQTIVAEDAAYLTDDALVVGIVVNGQPRAYPYAVLDWHEVVNEDFRDKPLNISYCPLTGTAIVFERLIDRSTFDFGVSGLLHNSNLIMFDRQTDSHWTQMRLQCDQGSFSGTRLKTYPSIETSWGSWKKLFPNTIVLSPNTGFVRNYESGESAYAQAGYSDLHEPPWFSVTHDDNRLLPKQKVHGVIFGKEPDNYETKVYAIRQRGSKERRLINDEVSGQPIVVIDDAANYFVVSYSRKLDTNILSFTLEDDSESFPFTIKDKETESTWSVLGLAIDGPLKGDKLEKTKSYNAYWFAWATFHIGADIYER